MADNFLENKFEELRNPKKQKTIIKQIGQSLDTLLVKNRSHRGYSHDVVVSRELLERLVAVNTKVPSARNQQCLRFKLITKDTGANTVLENIKLGGALPELHLPYPGTEPEAFIIICSTQPESKLVDIDLGISVQSMLLKAVELGLNGIIIGAFNKANIQQAFNLPYEPLLILAIGKGIEHIQLVDIAETESHNYYRQDDIHYVPKVRTSDLII